ncbi:MAG: acyloxyacyl hydrolase [Bacteroidales bacterium]|nr:acyloxyacyl hydrolase [Bacteroidales bacterium]
MERQKNHIILLVLLPFLLIGKTVSAQLGQKNYEVEARMHYGYMYFQNDEYHSALGRYSRHTPAYEFSLHRNTYGQHRWEVLHNYPSIGFTFYYSGFGNDSISAELGKVFALYPFIRFPLMPSLDSRLTFKLGVGLSWLTNKFDPKENFHNYAIGSHLNAAVNLSFEYRQRIIDRLHWVTSVGLTHFSNGATRSPNMGINIFSVATGLSWYLAPPKAAIDKRLRPKNYLFEFDGKRHFITDIQYTFGIKDLSQQYGTHQYFFVHNLAGNFMLQISERDRLGIGLEYVIDQSGEIIHPGWTNELGVLLSYEMMLDRVSFMFNLGIRNNEALLAKAFLFYQKVGARYYFTDHLFATLSFTTYDIKADFISFGLGYHFQHKYYLPRYAKKPFRSPVYPR